MKKNLCAFAAVVATVGLLALAGCAPQEGAAGQSASAGEPSAAGFTWSADADCAMCHATENDSLTDASCEISASHGQLTCASCHTDTAGLEKAHDGVDPGNYKAPKKLKDSEVSPDACLSCHDQAEVAAATADLTVLTDDNGTTVNPHELPANDEHANLTCAKCHTMHKAGDPQTDAPVACANCHHAGVYECHTCHS